MTSSTASLLASLPAQDRKRILTSLSEDQAKELLWDWRFWARPNQIAPEGEWRTWLALAGRGFGKTEAGAQWVRERVKSGARSIAIVAETQKDLEEVMAPRIIAVHPPGEAPTVRFRPVRITWPNGAQALGYNGTEPNQLRGPEFDAAWIDELAKYRYARETWDMLQFTMRRGDDPRVFVSTTPRPIPIIRELIAAKTTVVTRGSTFDNRENLAEAFIQQIITRYEGTRLGRQELQGEVLDDLPGALWNRDAIDQRRVKSPPDMQRIVVAVDPSGTKGDSDDGDSIGIVVAGKGVDGRGYVLADRTCKLSPDGWGRRAVAAYHEFKADRIVAERNFGGAMVEHVIKTVDRNASYKEVTASRGKVARAEPIAALYEQCIAEGQLVETDNGPVPIEDIRPGDLVWTRKGLKKVLWSGQTGERETVVIRHEGGQLECTEDHPIYSQRGFINAGLLAPKEHILLGWEKFRNTNALIAGRQSGSPIGGASLAPLWRGGKRESLNALSWNTVASGIISNLMDTGALLGTPGMSFCTEPSGGMSAGKYPMGGISTISTGTRATMKSRIFWPSTPEAMLSIITMLSGSSQTMSSLRWLLRSGNDGHLSSLRRMFATSVARSLRAGALEFGSAPLPATHAIGLGSVEKSAGKRVYNLHVEDCHEFFAGGILVHNCRVSHVGSFPDLEDQMCLIGPDGYAGEGSPDRCDALVWALTELMMTEPPKPAVFSTYGNSR